MKKDKKLAQVFHYDLYGKRAEKYSFLLNNNLHTVPWRELELSEPQYFFVAKDFSMKKTGYGSKRKTPAARHATNKKPMSVFLAALPM